MITSTSYTPFFSDKGLLKKYWSGIALPKSAGDVPGPTAFWTIQGPPSVITVNILSLESRCSWSPARKAFHTLVTLCGRPSREGTRKYAHRLPNGKQKLINKVSSSPSLPFRMWGWRAMFLSALSESQTKSFAGEESHERGKRWVFSLSASF